jgi:predicted esterase
LPFADSNRGVALYSLKERGEPGDIVVYCSDGQSTRAFAQQFYSANGAGIWFVGVDCSPEFRNAEYVIEREDASFAVHESFFVTTVVDWAAKLIGIQPARERSAVFGFSCGGSFAASIGIRHPEVYGAIFAFSIAGRPITNFEAHPDSKLSDVGFYFRAGSREPKGMRGYMKRLANWLRSADAQVDNATLQGGHEFALWSNALNECMRLAYQPKPHPPMQSSSPSSRSRMGHSPGRTR